MTKSAQLTVQRWGNSLAVRIPAAIARSAGFRAGQPVSLAAQDSSVLVTAAGHPRLTLKQKLDLFDPVRHGGEAMPSLPVGKEVF